MSDQNQLPAVSEAMREAVARGLLIAREMIAEKFGTWSPEHGHIFAGREVEAIQAIDDALDLASEIARLTGERDEALSAAESLHANVLTLSGQVSLLAASVKEERAATEADLTRMRAETERLRAALEPFACEAERYDPSEGDDHDLIWGDVRLRIGHLRQARAALSNPEQTDV